MSANIVLPTLSAWAAARLTGLLQSKTQNDFDAAFDATFAANLNVTYNGKQLSRADYKTVLLAESAAGFAERAAVVSIEGQTEIETGNQGQLSGSVGLFYTSLLDSKFLVLGAPAESKATSSINLVIEPTEKNPQNPKLPIRGFFDPRRVIAVNQVASESTYHVTIPAASVPKTTSSSSTTELGPKPLNIPSDYHAKRRGGLSTFQTLGQGVFGGAFGPGPVIPRSGAKPEGFPGDGEFGVAPVTIPGETIGGSNA